MRKYGTNGDENGKHGKGTPVHRYVKMVVKTVFGVVCAVIFALLFGFLVQALWNWLMPVIFELPEITYWQAFGVLILSKVLFGGFGHGCGHNCCRRSHRGMKDPCNGFSGSEEDELWKPKGSHRNWKYYEQYWKDEGKEAFEAYIQKVENEKKEE
ncbi:MAG: hypothetical protein GY940_14795 [bacterium]|nr:hypothetical protein [bacterium]